MSTIYSDGFFNNRTYGFTIIDSNKYILMKQSYPIKNKITDTVNTAEYLGVINALNIAEKKSTIISDSMLVVQQVNHKWKVNLPHLIKLRDIAYNLLREKSLHLQWIKRNNNIAGLYNENKLSEYVENISTIPPIIVSFEDIGPDVSIELEYKQPEIKINNKSKNKHIKNIHKPIYGSLNTQKVNNISKKDDVISLLLLALKEIDKDSFISCHIESAQDIIKDSIILLLEK